MALIGRIPNNEFAGESTITSVVFGSKCNFIGQNAFRDCISLSTINNDNMIENIQPYAFANCNNLLSVNFNKLTINLCSNAFANCNNLKSVNMSQCINIPTNAFANCYNLTYINIPNVTEIGVSAFSSCYNLMSVNIEKQFYKINPYAFYGCSNLKDINLNKCLHIGEYAFDCCKSLNTINISMCSFIGSYAFNECINISQVTLSSCDRICIGAFANCYNLNKVYINNPESHFCYLDSAHVFCTHTSSLCSINSGITFYFRADVIDKYKTDQYWKYYKDYMMTLAQNNQILYTTNNEEPINIEEYNNNSTTTNTAVNLKSTNYIIMEFKNKVDNLNYGIFKGSSTLTSIDMPFGCQSIGANEFENCISLEEFKPSDALKHIYDYAFKNCESLSSFTIPESVETLGEGIFAGCKNIDTFKGNEKFIKYNGKSLVYNNKLICVLPNDNSDTEGRFYKISNIDANIGRLGKSCFYGCKNMRRVDIPSSVTEIGRGAFEECTNLYEIHFEGDVPPTIENGVFKNIHEDFKIFVPESSLSKYNEKWKDLKNHIYPKAENDCIIYYGDKLELNNNTIQYDHDTVSDESVINGTYHKLSFKQSIKYLPNYFTNTLIEKIIIGDNITKIGESAFKNCKKLNYIYLSDMINEFGTECFYNCENLTRIHIPRKLFDDKELNIGNDIFCGCSKLKEFGSYVKGVVSDDNRCVIKNQKLIFFASGDISEYTIPNNITTIHKSVFRCTELERITLTESITTIEQSIFENCTNLEYISNWNNVVSIPERAFSGCKNLGEITLPENLKSIDKHAFSGCEKMYINTNIPTSVEIIGEYAFSECTNFKCVINGDEQILNIGDISYIDKNTFEKCTSLTKVSIGSNVEAIGECAFSECTNLNEVILPIDSCIKSIEDLAFYKCENLTDLNLSNDLINIGNSAFEKCKKYKGNSLIAVDGSKSYILTIPESLSNMGISCFQESGVEFLNIPGDRVLPGIPHKAFCGCEELTTITMSTAQNLQYISADAFTGCSNLRGDANNQLNLPESIKIIDDRAFQGCNSISRVYLQKGISSLGNFCFETGRSTDFFFSHNTVLDTPPMFTIELIPNKDNSYPFGKVTDISTTETKIYVYNDVLELFKTNEYWSKYADYIFVMP